MTKDNNPPFYESKKDLLPFFFRFHEEITNNIRVPKEKLTYSQTLIGLYENIPKYGSTSKCYRPLKPISKILTNDKRKEFF